MIESSWVRVSPKKTFLAPPDMLCFRTACDKISLRENVISISIVPLCSKGVTIICSLVFCIASPPQSHDLINNANYSG